MVTGLPRLYQVPQVPRIRCTWLSRYLSQFFFLGYHLGATALASLRACLNDGTRRSSCWVMRCQCGPRPPPQDGCGSQSQYTRYMTLCGHVAGALRSQGWEILVTVGFHIVGAFFLSCVYTCNGDTHVTPSLFCKSKVFHASEKSRLLLLIILCRTSIYR